MDNSAIADNFSMLAKLIDIHGDNSFKAKSYANAAFAIDKLPAQLSALPVDKIFSVKGIGESIGKKIIEQLQTERLHELDAYIVKTPVGLLEMMKIKGLGPKKIATIWKDLEIESIGELLYACNENRLLLYKGFGEKNQQSIKEAIEFFLNNQGSFLFAQIEDYAGNLTALLEKDLSFTFLITGDFRKHAEIIHKLEWVTDCEAATLKKYFADKDYTIDEQSEFLTAIGPENCALHFYCTPVGKLYEKLFETSASSAFLAEWKQHAGIPAEVSFSSEEEIFSLQNLSYIPPFLRENAGILSLAKIDQLPVVIQPEDIKGIIHTHSNWSDGSHTVEEMAKGAMEKGYEYLVISDHSKSAFYANGLFPDRIKAQHLLIDELNSQLKPFKIFKSIESDILNDGSLDYDAAVLSTFDLVIASVHSNLKMTEEKAMSRLLKAVANPYTTILGHMTGRLLLSRNGYPVNYDEIIEACVHYKVAIELNAHPRRLDLDWRLIEKAVSKNVLISINPDSHAVNKFSDVRYGVLAAQKGGLTKHQNLSSFSLLQFQDYVDNQKLKL